MSHDRDRAAVTAVDPAFVPPRTELGELLRRLRRVALETADRLLSQAELEAEMDRIRGRDHPPSPRGRRC